jgi:hypothetical protein
VINNNEAATNKTEVNLTTVCPRATKMRFATTMTQLENTDWVIFQPEYS